MFAWKFFAPGAVAPFTGVRWPDSGWVESVRDGDQGVHACAVEHLPYWLDAELWEVELDGPIARATRQLVGRRGRLVARVEEWPRARDEFTAACVDRTRRRISDALLRGLDGSAFVGYLDDAIRRRCYPGTCAYIAARAAAATDGLCGHEQERAAQAEWLATRLHLAHR
jgi:hypothetical protein